MFKSKLTPEERQQRRDAAFKKVEDVIRQQGPLSWYAASKAVGLSGPERAIYQTTGGFGRQCFGSMHECGHVVEERVLGDEKSGETQRPLLVAGPKSECAKCAARATAEERSARERMERRAERQKIAIAAEEERVRKAKERRIRRAIEPQKDGARHMALMSESRALVNSALVHSIEPTDGGGFVVRIGMAEQRDYKATADEAAHVLAFKNKSTVDDAARLLRAIEAEHESGDRAITMARKHDEPVEPPAWSKHMP